MKSGGWLRSQGKAQRPRRRGLATAKQTGERPGTESALHIRLTGRRRADGTWLAVGEREDGTVTEDAEVSGVISIEDALDAAISREVELRVSDEVYQRMHDAGDAWYPRPASARC